MRANAENNKEIKRFVMLPLNLLSKKQKKKIWDSDCKHKKLIVVDTHKAGQMIKRDNDGTEWFSMFDHIYLECPVCGFFAENRMVGTSKNEYNVGDVLKKEDRGWVSELPRELKDKIVAE